MGSTTHLPRIQPDARCIGKCGPRRRERKRTIRTLGEKKETKKKVRQTNRKEKTRKIIQEREEKQAAEREEKKERKD